MLNIVIPMAGRGSRFVQEGYPEPKPLIPIHGTPMIRYVIDNLTPSRPHRFIFICQAAHLQEHDLGAYLRSVCPTSQIIPLDGITQGAACSVLTAEHLIDSNDPLMIANCDQYVEFSIDDYLVSMENNRRDGQIMTMKANDPKWSYVKLSKSGQVELVVEKVVVSDEATVGIYNYRSGAGFVRSAKQMIAANDRCNNEFYVAPAYNYMIREGLRIGTYSVGSVGAGMYGLGIPTDLELFRSLPVSHRIGRRMAA
ncbi:MAG: glycosyltransferase family 2 protein [Planctomycetota bacterium]|jgi:dTDP-glucose pyrophosphorylase